MAWLSGGPGSGPVEGRETTRAMREATSASKPRPSSAPWPVGTSGFGDVFPEGGPPISGDPGRLEPFELDLDRPKSPRMAPAPRRPREDTRSRLSAGAPDLPTRGEPSRRGELEVESAGEEGREGV